MSDMEISLIIICSLIAYLIGSVNTAIILSKLKGEDIRTKGSGNAGATNTLRVMGKKAALLVALFDGIKGVIAILIARIIVKVFGGVSVAPVYLSALFVMIGHIYPLYFGFKGGKGIMTTIAVVFMLDWRIGLILFGVCIFIMLASGYVSLGSCIGALMFPCLVAAFHWGDILFIIVSALIGALAIYKHSSNISRLISGTESKLNFKTKR